MCDGEAPRCPNKPDGTRAGVPAELAPCEVPHGGHVLQNVFWVWLSSCGAAGLLQGVKSKLLSAGDVLNLNPAWGQKRYSGAA